MLWKYDSGMWFPTLSIVLISILYKKKKIEAIARLSDLHSEQQEIIEGLI